MIFARGLFIKTGNKKNSELGQVFHYDVFGKREEKYNFLSESNLNDINFNEIKPVGKQYYFIPQDMTLKSIYEKGIKISDLFPVQGNGIVTKRDNLCIQATADKCLQSALDIITLEKSNFYKKYNLPADVRDWKYDWAKKDIQDSFKDQTCVKHINYRPFDKKYIYYTGNSRGFVGWPVDKIMRNYLQSEGNLGLLCTKAHKDQSFAHIFVTNTITEAIFLSSKTGSNAMNLPLYIYYEDLTTEGKICRKPNLEKKYIDKISSIIKRKFSDEISTESQNFSPIDILNYVYAVLHSRIYREKYNNFLKIDFPRVPYPKDQNTFGQLVGLGNQLRKLHLMEDSTLKAIFQYPESGDNIVEKHVYKDGNVYINDEQYFANVPEVAWNFYIGGYQPAQKWLKDRKGQALQFEDIKHYQKMIATLQRTSEIMEEIDQIDFM